MRVMSRIENKQLIIRITRVLLIVGGVFLIVLGVAILASDWVENSVESNLLMIWERQPSPPHSLPPRWVGKMYLLGVETLVGGLLMGVFGWLVLPRWTSVISLTRKKHFFLIASILALVALWLPVIVIGHSASIAGERYWWLGDDYMISMRYARNLANGDGLVWNPGERVEGYTNFLWTLWMALVHLLPIHVSKTSLVVLLTNIVIAVAIIPVLIRLVKLLGGGELIIGATLLAYVFSVNAMYYTAAGAETTLLTFVFLIGICRVVQESRINHPKLPTYLLIITLSLIRADAAVLAALLFGVSLVLNKDRKKVFIYSLVSLLLPFVHEIFRFLYYGDILPNTAYLKVIGWNERYAFGFKYVFSFMKNYSFLIVFAVVGSLFSRQLTFRVLLGTLFLYAAYIVYVGGDAFHHFRFFIPVIPLLVVLAFQGIQNVGLQGGKRLFFIVLCIVSMPRIIPGYTLFFLLPRPADMNNVRLGLMLKQNTPVSTKIADGWAGSIFYFSERYAIDLLGKSDRHIAHLPVVSHEAKSGHNKFDYDYSLGVLKPDLVVSYFKLPVDEEEMREKTKSDWAFIGHLYFNSIFQEHCLPNPVSAETWRTVFKCSWSPLMEAKDKWKELSFN